MKKIFLLMLLLFVFFLVSCSSESVSTSVKVVGLTYETQTNLNEVFNYNSINFQLSNSKINNQEYIFPGDELNFTVEIEDPNFEIISFLAIVFNEETIRANTADSIVSTRDCGANICLDFPFIVESGVTEYSVNEVKFAKLNVSEGVSAIIDNTSKNVLTLEIYEDSTSPYVTEAVNLLNEVYSALTFYENHKIMTSDEWNEMMSDPTFSRRLIFINFEGSIIINSQIFKDGKPEEEVTEDDFFWWHEGIDEDGNYFGGGGTSNQISIEMAGFSLETDPPGAVYYPHMYINFRSIEFKDVYFTNIENTIYVNFGDIAVPMITFSNHTQLVRVSEEYFTYEG